MAIRTFYFKDTLAAGSVGLDDVEIQPSPLTGATGWVVAKIASGNYAKMDSNTTRTSAGFGATLAPVSPLDNTLGDFVEIGSVGSGSFQSGNWTLSFGVIATTVSSQAGRARFRVYQGASSASVVEKTTAVQIGNIVTVTGTEAVSSASWTAPAISMSATDKLFVQIGWATTTAGGNNNANVLMREGANSKVVTTNFSASISLSSFDFLSMAGD